MYVARIRYSKWEDTYIYGELRSFRPSVGIQYIYLISIKFSQSYDEIRMNNDVRKEKIP